MNQDKSGKQIKTDYFNKKLIASNNHSPLVVLEIYIVIEIMLLKENML